MKKSGILIYLLLSVVAGVMIVTYASDPEIVITVANEEKSPIQGATIDIGWNLPRGMGEGGGSGESVGMSGITDDKGVAKFHIAAPPGINVEKYGYYKDYVNSGNRLITSQFKNIFFSLNRPKVEFTLLKKINPVPMYVRRVELRFPHPGQSMGFDFEAADWVIPFGAGHHADMMVEAIRRGDKIDDFDLSVNIAFEESGDGIILQRHAVRDQISELRLVREAPMGGYLQTISWVDYVHASEAQIAELEKNKDYFPGSRDPRFQTELFNRTTDDNYIFRIRSKFTEDGQVAKPRYGKIHGPICIDEKGINFLYFLNPSGSRSLEWDMVHNLAGEQIIPHQP